MSSQQEPPTTSGFEAFARRARPVLLAYALELLGEPDMAEDVAQTVLLSLWTGGTWEEIESPGAYCRRAAHREALRVLESRRRSESISAVPPQARSTAPGPWDRVVRREQHTALMAALRRLPERCAFVMTLKLVEGLAHSEIARRTGIGVGGVEKQVARGKRYIRRWMTSGPEGELVWLSSLEDGGG